MNYGRFMYAFIISRTRVFKVEYGAIKENKDWYFATSAAKFNRPKTDWKTCGQCQNEVLSGRKTAYDFFKKWDNKHCKPLSKDEYDDLLKDIDELKKTYPLFIYKDKDYQLNHIPFCEEKNLSMLFE